MYVVIVRILHLLQVIRILSVIFNFHPKVPSMAHLHNNCKELSRIT